MVNVHIRGGLGDTAIAMLKFDAIKDKHFGEYIMAWINSSKPDLVIEFIHCHNIFDRFKILSYNRNIKIEYIQDFKDKNSVWYDLNNWYNNRLHTIEEIHPELDINYYPKIASTPKKVENYVVIQVKGRTGGRIWELEKWNELIKHIDMPVYCLGNTNGTPKGIEKNIFFSSIQNLVNFINNARLFIGIDSGLKNIALICKTPTLMLFDEKYPMANPKEVWFPFEYQKNRKNKILPVETEVDEVLEWVEKISKKVLIGV